MGIRFRHLSQNGPVILCCVVVGMFFCWRWKNWRDFSHTEKTQGFPQVSSEPCCRIRLTLTCSSPMPLSPYMLLAAMTSASGSCLSSCLLSCCWRAAAQQQRRLRYRLLESCFLKNLSYVVLVFESIRSLSLSPKCSPLSLSAFLSPGGAAGGSAVSVLLCALVTRHQQWDSDLKGKLHTTCWLFGINRGENETYWQCSFIKEVSL